MQRFAALLVALAACGDDGGSPPQVDASMTLKDAPKVVDAPMIDAPTSTVIEVVSCPASPDAEVTSTNGVFSFSPETTTVTIGQTVKFVMASSHNVVPNPAGGATDAVLTVGFSETKCFLVKMAAELNFKCGPHSFAGKLVIQ